MIGIIGSQISVFFFMSPVYLFLIILFIYFWLLHWFFTGSSLLLRLFSLVAEIGGYFLLVICGLLIAVAPLAVELRL